MSRLRPRAPSRRSTRIRRRENERDLRDNDRDRRVRRDNGRRARGRRDCGRNDRFCLSFLRHVRRDNYNFPVRVYYRLFFRARAHARGNDHHYHSNARRNTFLSFLRFPYTPHFDLIYLPTVPIRLSTVFS